MIEAGEDAGAGGGCGGEGPATIAMQPAPATLQVVHIWHAPGRCTTGISRGWAPEEAAACRLCPAGECNFNGATCLVGVNGFVPAESAALFAKLGRPRNEAPGLGVDVHPHRHGAG